MSTRISPRSEESPSASSPSERTTRRRSSAKSWSSASAANRRGAQISPTSEEPEWADPSEGEREGGSAARYSYSSQGGRRSSSSIPHAPPAAEEDSFYEEDDSQKSENVLGNWHFAPLLIALLPPLGAVVGGQADAWSDAILLLLASFWLYQFLKVPHDIYHAARTRRILQADVDEAEEEEERQLNADPSADVYRETAHRRKERAQAAAELRRAEKMSLVALVLSPLFGAWLLMWLMEVFTDGNRYLNKFNIRLFMLASGIKPWSHALSLFRQRLLHLHEVVHYPSSRVEALNRRLARLESDLSTLRKLVATKSDVSLLRDGIDLPLTQLSRTMRRYEKKEEHLRMSAEDKFGLVESRLEDLLREVAINAELIEEERRERQRAVSLPASIFQALRYALGQRSQEQHYMYTPDGQRVLSHTASLGITAHANDALSPGTKGGVNGGTISASSSTSSTSDGPSPAYGSPPRYGAAGSGATLTVSSAPAQQSPSPGWTEEGLAYWVFLPINIPRSVFRGAMSFAGGRYNAARDANYAQSYAAAMNAATRDNQQGAQIHRLTASSNANGKARSPYGERIDHRPTVATTTTPNAASTAHFTRRV